MCITNLIFNEQCRIVARFKDFLILDDMTEFLRRFYTKKELKRRLNKIFNFYENYSKIFPNYMILAENKYLYRNIRKKQKVIDAFNQIKKEEEENRISLKKKEEGEMVIFNESIQESINRYHPSRTSFLFNSFISGIIRKNNEEDNDSNLNSLINISINKINNKMMNSNNNSFEYINDKETLNSENSIRNIIQILNNKFDKIIDNKFNNNQNGQLYDNNNEKSNNSKIFKKNNEKINKNLIKKDISNSNKNKTIYKEINNNYNKNDNISTPPKASSPGHNKSIKGHNHQKSALNNNKKFISHKQAISVSNNNTIKIINNINNIIINEPNINKEMVISINTNYFQLNSTNLNTFNKMKNRNKNMNNNILNKKIKIRNKDKNKEISINSGKEILMTKKLNKEQNNLFNNTFEEKAMNAYNNQLLNLENHHYNSNSINIENNKIINTDFININNNTISHINTSKNNNNKSVLRKYNNQNKIIKGITEYRTINVNNIGNNGIINKNKRKNNYIKKEINKKAITINAENYKKSQKNKRKKLELLIGINDKKNTNKHIFNQNIQNKKDLDIFKTEGNINYSINSNYMKNYYNSIDYNNKSYNVNINDKNDIFGIQNNQIKSKLNKKFITRKQKTNSLQINNKNKNNFFSSFCKNFKLTKDFNCIKMNKNKGSINLINEHIKYFTQVNLDSENQANKKIFNYKDSKEVSENKLKTISAKEMKEKYHKFIMGNKIIHGSYDTSNRLHLFKKFNYLYKNNNSISKTINNTNISHKKIIDIKSPYNFNNIVGKSAHKKMNKNSCKINSFNEKGNSYKIYEKTTLNGKTKLHKKEEIHGKNKHIFYKINGIKNRIFIGDTNNKKMKYVKK